MTNWKSHWHQQARAGPSRVEPGPIGIKAPTAARIERRNLNTEEAATYLGLSRRTMERYRVDGTGPRFLKAGPGERARVFYRREDLDAWLEGTAYTSTSEYGS